MVILLLKYMGDPNVTDNKVSILQLQAIFCYFKLQQMIRDNMQDLFNAGQNIAYKIESSIIQFIILKID